MKRISSPLQELLDHAMIAEGQLKDPQGFAQRLQSLMAKAANAL